MTRSDNSKSPEQKAIDSMALALAFVATGLVLSIDPNFFGDTSVGNVVRVVFIIIGVGGFFTSFNGKRKKQMSNIGTGIFLLGVVAIIKNYCHVTEIVIAGLVGAANVSLLLLGLYGILSGVVEIIYFELIYSNKTLSEVGTTKQSKAFVIFELITKLAALILVILQIIKLINT